MSQKENRKPTKPPPDQALARHIRNQAGERATRIFLINLPAFKVVPDLPEHMKTLLKRLESIETGTGGTGATAP